jgi:hypothetical protein
VRTVVADEDRVAFVDRQRTVRVIGTRVETGASADECDEKD